MTREQFIKAVEREQGSLRRFLRSLCRDASATDDIAQEALLKAYLHFGDFNGKSKFSTWLYRIAYNTFSDWSTSSSKKKSAPPLDAPSCRKIAAEQETKKDYQPLYDAIGGLSDKERICVLLFYMEERSIVEITRITDMPSGTVKSHLSRARIHLKARLQTLEEWK